jgi:hypothetical protein
MSKEILQRVKLLMEYDMSKTSSENLSSLNESKVLATIVQGTGKNVVDDILKSASIVDDAGKAILKRGDLVKFLSTGGKKAVSKAVARLNTDFLRSPGVLRASKSLIIDDMVKSKTFIDQFAGKTTTQIKNQLKGFGYADDVADEIAKKTSAALKSGGGTRVIPRRPKPKPPGITDRIWGQAQVVILRVKTWTKFLAWAIGIGLTATAAYLLWEALTGEDKDEGGTPIPKPKPESKYRDCTGKEVISFGCKSSDVKRLQGCIGVEPDGSWGPKTQKKMVQLGLGQGISVVDIDQICKTQKKAEEDAVKRIEDTPNPRVRGTESDLEYGNTQAGINVNVPNSIGSVDDFS